jgi:hypothetical protein
VVDAFARSVHMLMRDARLAAAMVLGPGVLPPPASFDAWIMLAATSIHFALSIIYGLIIAPLVSRSSIEWSLLIGALFGLAIYFVNMYGFTLLFPWFATTRDPITATAHAVFGISLAATCHAVSRRSRTR